MGAALAAALIAAVGALLLWQRAGGTAPSTERLASLVRGEGIGSAQPGGRILRGVDDSKEPATVPLDREAFWLGAWVLDLRLFLESSNDQGAANTLSKLHGLFHRMTPPPVAAAAYDQIAAKLRGSPRVQPASPPTLLAEADAAERQVLEESQEDPRMVALGGWTEACRLADISHRPDLFRDPASLRILDRAMQDAGKDEDPLDSHAAPLVRSIRQDLAAGRIDTARLAAACAELSRTLEIE